MNRTAISYILKLFMPEESGLNINLSSGTRHGRMITVKRTVSVKAIVWIVLSIIMSLILGQLN